MERRFESRTNKPISPGRRSGERFQPCPLLAHRRSRDSTAARTEALAPFCDTRVIVDAVRRPAVLGEVMLAAGIHDHLGRRVRSLEKNREELFGLSERAARV